MTLGTILLGIRITLTKESGWKPPPEGIVERLRMRGFLPPPEGAYRWGFSEFGVTNNERIERYN